MGDVTPIRPNASSPSDSGGKRPPDRPPMVRSAFLRSEALRLATAGLTHQAIADHVTAQLEAWEPPQKGITARRVGQIIAKALAEMQEADTALVENVRAQQLARIDRLLLGVWTKATDPKHAEHLRAVREVARLEALRAKIAGTEAPRQVEHSGSVDVEVFNQAEIDRTEQAWLNSGGDGEGEVIDSDAVELPALPAGT